MSRRSTAILLGLVLMLMLVVAAIRSPVPFVSHEPGPTLDVLARSAGEPIVDVEGHKTYETEGSLRLVTVSESTAEHKVLVLEAMNAWWRPSMALIPREVAFPAETTNSEERAASAAQMVSSQDTAIAAALRELDYDLESFPVVSGITPGGPSEDKLKVRDRIVSINGWDTPGAADVFNAVVALEPRQDVVIEVRRGSALKRVTITTEPNPDNPDIALIGIFPSTGYDFPFDVTVGIDSSIGGPSAGLIFALAVYDALTPGGLTGGTDVAGTGTIDDEGAVGPIGGIQQKIAGARRDGATLFLVPPDNCETALSAPVEEDEIALVPAATLDDAIDAVQTHADDPDAELPRCTDES